MCVVSMVADHYYEKWATPTTSYKYTFVTQADFDALKKEVLEMKELLRKAKLYDVEHHEPNCEKEDKIAVLKKIAEMVGVDLNEVAK